MGRQAREGEATFKKIDMGAYTQQTFGMYQGKNPPKLIAVRFINKDVNTTVDWFGAHGGSVYKQIDKNHFTVTIFRLAFEFRPRTQTHRAG